MTEPQTFGPGGDAPHAQPLEYATAADQAPAPAQDAPRWAYAIGSGFRFIGKALVLAALVELLAGSVWLGGLLWGVHLKWWALSYTTGLGLGLYSTAQHFTARARRYAAATTADVLAAKLRKKSS